MRPTYPQKLLLPPSMSLIRLIVFTLFAGLALLLSAPYVHGVTKQTITNPIPKIVSLGPDVTEILFALGVDDQIIAVDRSSRYPEKANEKTNVGYRRALSAEGVLSLSPDLIIASEDIGPPEAVDVINQSKIPVLYIPVDNSRDGIARKVKIIAQALGLEERGNQLTQSILADFDAAVLHADNLAKGQRKKVVFFHGLTRLTGAGRNTAADAFIRYAGGENPISDYEGYKSVSEEWLLQAAPDVILMLPDSTGGPKAEDVFAVNGLKDTPAAQNKALIILDGPYMLGFGPRTAQAIRNLAESLYSR